MFQGHCTIDSLVSHNCVTVCHIFRAESKSRHSYVPQGAHLSGKSQGNLIFLQGQGKVREFCKMVREIRKSSKVRQKSGNLKSCFVNPSKIEQTDMRR